MSSARANWVELTIEAPSGGIEAAEEAMLAAGAIAVTLRDAGQDEILEPLPGHTPVWQRTLVTGLFDAHGTRAAGVAREIEARLGALWQGTYRVNTIGDRDWQDAWKDHCHPMRFGERLWVCPRHLDPPDAAAVNVRMDPGLAFGTGTHPTTALCLRWLDSQAAMPSPVIDFGCGSGILAIAASLLGADQVWAVDIDPQALHATTENARYNGVAESVHACPPEHLPEINAGLVIANILSGPLVALAPRLRALTEIGGHLVLSGLLARQADEIMSAYRPWFHFESSTPSDGWVQLHGVRLPSSDSATGDLLAGR